MYKDQIEHEYTLRAQKYIHDTHLNFGPNTLL